MSNCNFVNRYFDHCLDWLNKKYAINICYCLILFNTNCQFNIHFTNQMVIDPYQNISISDTNSGCFCLSFYFYLSIAYSLFYHLVLEMQAHQTKYLMPNVGLSIQRMNKLIHTCFIFICPLSNGCSLQYLVGCERSKHECEQSEHDGE